MEKETNPSIEFPQENLSNIYKKICINDDVEEFENIEQKTYINLHIERILKNDKIVELEEKDILKDILLVNISFAKIHREFKTMGFTKVHFVFIEFCEYLDIPYDKTYFVLHDKLKTFIKNSTIKYIGVKKFKDIEKKINKNKKVTTLFDLL